MTKASVWVSRLTLATAPTLLRVIRRHGRIRLSYTSATASGRFLVRLLAFVGGLSEPARAVVFTGHGERVDDPASPVFAIQARVNEFCHAAFAAHAGLLERFRYPDHRVCAEQVRVNFRKAMAHTTYELLGFVEFARYREAAEGADRRLVVISPAAVLADCGPAGWTGGQAELRCPWSVRHSLWLRLARAVAWTLVAARPRRSTRGPASVAVEAAWSLDRDARLNDLFWWWDSGIPADRVLFFFDQPNVRATPDMVARLGGLGIRHVVTDTRGAGMGSKTVWRPAAGPAASVARLARLVAVAAWGVRHPGFGRWMAVRAIDMLQWSARAEDFLKEFNVCAVFHSSDIEADPIALASEITGAARIGVQWSDVHWPQTYHARLHQVFFLWGPLHARMLRATGSSVNHVLLSGCIVRCVRGDASGHHAPRAELAAAGATRVLALFDTSLPCENFYEFFLRQVLQDQRWGLLVKPKGLDSPPWARPVRMLSELWDQARATGRVRLLDPRVSPAAAAAAADFAVGVDVNSATVIAALSGHRAIHLDYVGLDRSPLADWAVFHRTGPDRLVFHDPERLWRRLNEALDRPENDDSLGRAGEAVLRQLDWFRDDQAGLRIGQYIKWYLAAVDDGWSRDGALAEADRRYAEIWGEAAVVRDAGQGDARAAAAELVMGVES